MASPELCRNKHSLCSEMAEREDCRFAEGLSVYLLPCARLSPDGIAHMKPITGDNLKCVAANQANRWRCWTLHKKSTVSL